MLMAIVVIVMVLLLGLLVLGWRARTRRQAGIPKPAPVPADLGPAIATLEGKYVATTASGDRLDRIAVHGLGFRGTAFVVVAEAGLLVQLPGKDLWIPRDDVLGLSRATWTIDRVVEPDGLQVVQWRLAEHRLESAFRMNEPRAFENAVHRLLERNPA